MRFTFTSEHFESAIPNKYRDASGPVNADDAAEIANGLIEEHHRMTMFLLNKTHDQLLMFILKNVPHEVLLGLIEKEPK